MTKKEKYYLKNKYLKIKALHNYNASKFKETKNDFFCSMMDMYSAQLHIMEEIIKDLDIMEEGD